MSFRPESSRAGSAGPGHPGALKHSPSAPQLAMVGGGGLRRVPGGSSSDLERLLASSGASSTRSPSHGRDPTVGGGSPLPADPCPGGGKTKQIHEANISPSGGQQEGNALPSPIERDAGCTSSPSVVAFGFGANQLGQQPSFCFPLTRNPTGQCSGMAGLLRAYR